MLTDDELRAVDDFRFKYRVPSRAAAVRELLNRGLRAESTGPATANVRSKDIGVLANAAGSSFDLRGAQNAPKAMLADGRQRRR